MSFLGSLEGVIVDIGFRRISERTVNFLYCTVHDRKDTESRPSSWAIVVCLYGMIVFLEVKHTVAPSLGREGMFRGAQRPGGRK